MGPILTYAAEEVLLLIERELANPAIQAEILAEIEYISQTLIDMLEKHKAQQL